MRWTTLAPFLVVLIGYALRLWRLDAFSISGDEVNSLFFATRPIAETFAALAATEPHPPFYYSFLRGWLAITGQSEFALRLPSVLFGTLAVSAGYAAGRGVGGRSVGVATAAVFAASQFSVLHAQDGRMYAALQAWAALYLAGLIGLLRRPGWMSWLIVVLSGTLAAYTHYHGFLLVLLGCVPLVLKATPLDLGRRLSPLVAISALYLPWMIFARGIFLDYRGWMDVVPPVEILRRSTVVYSVGEGVGGFTGTLALFVLPVFALVGLVSLTVGRHWRWLGLLMSLGALPLAAVIAGSLTQRPLYHERYLIIVTPAYFTLAGLGLARLSRMPLARLPVWGGFAGLGVVALAAYYWPAMPQKTDFRETVALLERAVVPPATVVMPAPQGPIVAYYLKDRLPTYVSRAEASAETVAGELAERLVGNREVWFVRYSAGTWDDTIGRWLEANAFYLGDVWVTQNHVVTYALAPPGSLTARSGSARTGAGVEITGVWAGPSQVRPGDHLLTSLHWDARGLRPPTTKVSLRLIDPWGQRVAALDRPLVNPAGLAEIETPPIWQGALAVPDDAVPARYRWEARFYDGASGQDLLVVDAAGRERPALDLGGVSVEPAAASALRPEALPAAPAVPVDAGLYVQNLRLSEGPYSPDTRLGAGFAWVALTQRAAPVVPELAVRSASGQIVASMRRDEAEQPYRLGRLRTGERVRERLELPLRAIAQAGTYTVEIRVGPGRPWAVLGAIDVAVDPNRYRRPELAQRRADLFDGAIRLTGATMPSDPVPAGTPLAVSLAWHAERLPTVPYTVFVHLVDGTGKLWAQSDQIPVGGSRPTVDWILGEHVVDEHRLPIPESLPTGDYRLLAGLYEAATGRRAEVTSQSVDGQAVELGRVRIAGRP